MGFRLLLIGSLLCSIGLARTLTDEEKLSELNQLASLIKSQYGPYQYKIKELKIDVDALVTEYAHQTKAVTNLEFYYALNRFVAEFKDSHFNCQLQTSHISTLGFIADRVEGRALLDTIDRSALPNSIFPFERGDEVIAIGRIGVADLIEDLRAHIGMGYSETSRRLATMLLGRRVGGVVRPRYGKTSVSIRRGTSDIIDTVELEWKQLGEPLEEDSATHRNTTQQPMDYLDLSTRDLVESTPRSERSYWCSGQTRIAVPQDAVVLMEKPFVAYSHSTPKGNVGYLRIPHYSWKNGATGADENELRFRQYEWVLGELEKKTVGLVIDQDHNCGGSVTLVEKMVSLFATAPYKGLEFQFLATRNEYLQLKTWIDENEQFTLIGADFLRVLDLVKSSWEKGESMTPKTTLRANRLLDPNPVRYSKPIVMLIDEMAGSGGDAFPAMMQGIGRAKLFGTRTMGAGGHIQEMPNLNYSGNTLRMTKSLFFRPDGTPVENNGAVPDYGYTTTRDDFLYEYRDYQKKYIETLLTLIL